MDIILNVYSTNVLLQFIFALFSIILTVTVIYIKRENERKLKRSYYDGVNNKEKKDVLGNIIIKIDEEIPSHNYLKLMTLWGIQPLLLLVLINFIDNENVILNIILIFGLLIFTLLHEFHTAFKYSHKTFYQLIMLAIWIISFMILSNGKNKFESDLNQSTTKEVHTTSVTSN